MIRYCLLSVLILISLTNFAKPDKEITLLYGKSTGAAKISFLRSSYMLRGIGPTYLRENNSVGLRFRTNISNIERLKLETGVNYLHGNLEHVPYLFDESSTNEEFNILSTPIYLNHYFGRYFFITEGIILDYQKSETNLYSGFGAGFGFGLGVKFDYNNFNFYINPKYERHLFLSKKYGLIEYGVMLGVGYIF